MADLRGSVYMINGQPVVAPDEEVWSAIEIGNALTGLQRRSPMQMLKWRRIVAERCDLDWWDFDNTALTSLTCTPPEDVGVNRTFTRTALCVSVTMRQGHGVAREVVATFLVDTR